MSEQEEFIEPVIGFYGYYNFSDWLWVEKGKIDRNNWGEWMAFYFEFERIRTEEFYC